MSSADAAWSRMLADLDTRSLRRSLRPLETPQGTEVVRDGRTLLNFSSNDYLGLASHPAIIAALREGAAHHGAGSGASRLLCGSLPPHGELEETLAAFKGTRAALAFSSGFAAALGTIPALFGKGDVLILDKLAHACLIDGSRLSGATLRVYPHNDLDRLESHLGWARKNFPNSRVGVITESVFSMDGDLCPLAEIVALKERFDAVLYLDEAHAFGLLGAGGRGLADALGLAPRVDVQMGTLSKAAGLAGGYVCASRAAIDLAINRARSFIYSTAPPPAIAAAAIRALEIIASDEGNQRRQRVLGHAAHFAAISGLGPVPAAIFAVKLGEESHALESARSLEASGFLVPAIRYPTVPKGGARLRITFSAAHSRPEIDRLTLAIAHGLEHLCPAVLPKAAKKKGELGALGQRDHGTMRI